MDQTSKNIESDIYKVNKNATDEDIKKIERIYKIKQALLEDYDAWTKGIPGMDSFIKYYQYHSTLDKTIESYFRKPKYYYSVAKKIYLKSPTKADEHIRAAMGIIRKYFASPSINAKLFRSGGILLYACKTKNLHLIGLVLSFPSIEVDPVITEFNTWLDKLKNKNEDEAAAFSDIKTVLERIKQIHDSVDNPTAASADGGSRRRTKKYKSKRSKSRKRK